jgi:hypothetical protein
MIGWLLLVNAGAFECELGFADGDRRPPPEESGGVERPLIYGTLDTEDLVLARLQGDRLGDGFDHDDLEQLVYEVVRGRGGSYDFVLVTHSDAFPAQFDHALAFHLAFNAAGLDGTGRWPALTPDIGVRSVIWMNGVGVVHPYGEVYHRWVFAHELGHAWLSYAWLDLGDGPEDTLLGRQRAHWSFFLNTPNSPMEGNAWIDHGDGTFSVDVEAPSRFSTLDLYMMGLAEPEEVEPTFFIEVEGESLYERESSPMHKRLGDPEPAVVEGRRVDVSLDDIVAVIGERPPEATAGSRELTLLTVFVAAPDERISTADLAQARANQALWAEAWGEHTQERSAVSFGVADEGWTLPALPRAPLLVPRGAR